MFTLAELEDVISLVRASVPATPQYAWPLLKVRTGVEVVVKHENHTPIGAFKVRGGIVYFDRLKGHRPPMSLRSTGGDANRRFCVGISAIAPARGRRREFGRTMIGKAFHARYASYWAALAIPALLMIPHMWLGVAGMSTWVTPK